MIHLRTLGSMDLQDADGAELRAVLAQPKRFALLAYLAAARPFGVHRRDQLLALFWPDLDDVRARDALSQALRFLRQALGHETLVRRGPEEVGIDADHLSCDAVAFRTALDEGRASEALELYRGDFLEGFFVEEAGGFEEWLELERASLREGAARGARQLAVQEEANGAITVAMSWGRRALELAPDDERGLRRLLELHERAGDRAGALRVYDVFARRLQTEYACEPAPETKALADRLRRGVESDGPTAREASARSRPAGKAEPAGMSAPLERVEAFRERYRIERELGAGGMAIVYLAHDLRHDRPVAVKVLRPEITEGLARGRFLREIRIAARLQHPNIVPLFDSGEADGRLYFVMPHVQGEALRERLVRDGRLEVGDVMHVLREIASALAYAHEHGVVHRDIKPENILLIGPRAVLTDFGIARAASAARTPDRPSEATLTQLGTSLGTPAYMAPEQAAGSAEVDHRVDVYALGVLAFEMLAGRPPFVGTAQQILAAHIAEQPPPIDELRGDVPSALGVVVMRCLQKDPDQRPGSATDIVQAIEGCEALPGEARVAEAPDRPRPDRQRGTHQRVVTALVSAVLALGLVLAWRQALSPVGEQSAATNSRDPRRLAVLYFDDHSSDRSLGYLADGLTEALIGQLAQVSAVNVISRNGVKAYRARDVPLDSVAAQLNVGSIVEGSVQRSGQRLRVGVALIDAVTRAPVDMTTIERPMTELFELQDELAARVSQFLRQRLGEEVRVRASRTGTRSLVAQDLLLRAARARADAAALASRPDSMDVRRAIATLGTADSLLRLAEAADPRWAAAPIARGWVWVSVGLLQSGAARVETLRRALGHAEQAVRMDSTNAAALEVRGTATWRYAHEIRTAPQARELARRGEQDLRRAVALDTTLASAWATLSRVLRDNGQFAEADVYAQRALDADAYLENAGDVLAHLYRSAMMLGDQARARDWCARAHRMRPDDWLFIECELVLMRLDLPRANPRRAWEIVNELERIDPPGNARAVGRPYTPHFRRLVAAAVTASQGDRDSARAVLARTLRDVADDAELRVDVLYDAAFVHLALGEHQAAQRLLDSYWTYRPDVRPLLARDPAFRSLERPMPRPAVSDSGTRPR